MFCFNFQRILSANILFSGVHSQLVVWIKNNLSWDNWFLFYDTPHLLLEDSRKLFRLLLLLEITTAKMVERIIEEAENSELGTFQIVICLYFVFDRVFFVPTTGDRHLSYNPVYILT